MYSTLPVYSVNARLVSPAIRDEFVGLVLGAMEITDSILDSLYQPVFCTAKERFPRANGEDLFSNNGNMSLDRLDEETCGNDNPLQTQSSLSCGSTTADSDKENMLPLQHTASLEIWDLGSITPDNKGLDDTGRSAIEIEFEKAVESLLQLSRDDTPAAANRGMDTGHRLADHSRLHNGPPPLVQPSQGSGSYNNSCCITSGEDSTESQRLPAKRRPVEGNYSPRKRAKSSGDLIVTTGAVHIGRGGAEVEALSFDSESGVWIDLDGVEYDFDDGIFTATRVAYGISYASPYCWRFQSNVDNEQESTFEF